MERLYFSKENFKILYGILQKKLVQSHKYDIENNDTFNKELINIMKTIYQQKSTFNMPSNISDMDSSRYLSQKVINVALQYFGDSIKKSNANTNSLDRDFNINNNTSVNKISDRPLSTNLQNSQNPNINYDSLLKDRETIAQRPAQINFTVPQDNMPKDDITKKFQELSNNRQSEYENIQPVNTHPSLASQFETTSINTNMQQPNMQQNMQQNMQPNMQQNMQQPNIQQPQPIQPSNAQYTNMQSNNLTTQQSFMNNPSNPDIQKLLMQQQSIQDQLNKYQTNISSNQAYSMSTVNHNDPQSSSLEEQFNAPVININTQPQPTQPFNPPPQTNIKFYSEDTTANSIIQNQFGTITESASGNMNSMEPDNNIDYTSILRNMNNDSGTTVNSQFNTEIQNLAETKDVKSSQVEKIFPTVTYTDDKPKQTIDNTITIKSVESDNVELEIIKKNIALQSKNIDDTNSKLQQLIVAIEKQDISKFYETILDIPRLIEQQKTQPLTIRTHNLIVSSRDRDLSITDFDKYNFRIVFGAQGSETVQDIKYDENGVSIGGDSNMEKYNYAETEYVSSGMKNPTVQQVLKNVISIKLKRVILPKPRDGTENYFPEPYYFVAVDEFTSNIISTKTFNDKLFCKIHFDKEFAFGERKYMYYKNDDDDYTLFYASPLGKLDRLTLKLLGSDGTSVKHLFGDTDIYKTTANHPVEFDPGTQFYDGSFPKDNILNATTVDTTNNKSRILSTSSTNNNITLVSDIVSDSGQLLVNLTNQIEYIFEIKTQEPDPTNQVRPILNN